VSELKVSLKERYKPRSWPLSRLDVLLATIVVLGTIIGLASTRLPFLYVAIAFAGIALFFLIYRYLWLGLGLFLLLNLTIPQAGPTWNLGMQVMVMGETRGLHFNVHEIVITMTLVAWILKCFLKEAEWKTSSPVIFAIILYMLTSILAGFVGLINGAKPLVLAFRFVRTTFFVYIFFLVINIVKTRYLFRNLVILMLVCATLVALFGLVQFAIGQSRTEWIAEHVLKKIGYPDDVNYVAGGGATQAYRINSTFLHPNILGGYLVFVLPFLVSLLSMAWRAGRKRAWWILLIALGINLGALFFTGSRAAWVAAGCIAIIYSIFGLKDKRVWLAAGTVFLVLVLIFFILSPPEFVKKRFSSLSATEAAEGRIYMYQLAFDFFLSHPVFGLGMGMEGQRIVENNLRATWAAVENAFLTYLVSHGLVGLIAFLLVFIMYWALLLHVRNNSPGDPFLYFLSEAFILGMVGYVIANMFGAWLLFAIPMHTLFWFFVGMGGSLYNIYREGEPAPARRYSLHLT